jgi:TRAP-type C4-dicarboxylate transport system substrate-binding protein
MKLKSLTAAMATVATLASGAALAETKLRVGTIAPTNSPWGQWAQTSADMIAEASNGELIIEIIGDAQLGDEQTILRQGMKGRVDIVMVSNIPLTLVGQEMDVFATPFLFDSVEQGTCVAYSHMSDILGPNMNDSGLIPLTWMEIGHYVTFSKEGHALTPDALQGKKLRVAATVSDEAFARRLGAVGVPMGTSDTIPALQTGNVEAAFLPGLFGIAIGTHKVAPFLTVSDHARPVGTVAISERVYSKLSDQEKEWLKIFEQTGPAMSATILGTQEALLKKVTDAGLPVVRLSQEQTAAWKASADGLREELAQKLGPKAVSLLEKIEAAKAACGS